MPKPSGLQVSVGTPRAISFSKQFHWYPNTLLRLHDGALLLGFSLFPDKHVSNLTESFHGALLKSTDDGANWFLLKHYRGEMHEAWPEYQLPDGTLVGRSSPLVLKYSGEAYHLSNRSRDGARTWEGPTEATLVFPPGTLFSLEQLHNPWHDPPAGWRLANFAFEGNVIQLANGDLLRAMDGKMPGDTLWRLCLIRSTDGGASWRYLSTIGDPNIEPWNYTESALICLPDGTLLCMMRTTWLEATPMYQSMSTDGGQTWSRPVSAGANGVKPSLLLMSNGVLVCAAGRMSAPPSLGNQLMFSLDGGHTWTNHTVIYHGPSTGYMGIVELRPGELLCTYDSLTLGWEEEHNSIMMVTVRVERGDGA